MKLGERASAQGGKRRTGPAPHAPPRGRVPGSGVGASPARVDWLSPAAPYLVPLALAIVARLVYWVTIPYAAEDAYITFRYAENWARGLGPVYNPGEHVMGFSSPLWTAWLAFGAAATGQTFLWSRLSGILLDAVTLILGARVLEGEESRASAWAFAGFFALFPTLGVFSVLGMETSLFLALLVGSAWAARHARPWIAGVLLGLLALTRPEGVVAAAIVAIGARWRSRAIGGGILAAGLAALAVYYGSPIPQSVIAKAATYGTPGPLAGLVWIEGLVPFFLRGKWPEVAEAQHLFPLGLVLFPAFVIGCVRLVRRPGAARLVAGAAWTILSAYVVLGVAYFAWYLVVPLAGWVWTAAVGLPALSRRRVLWGTLAVYLVADARYLGSHYVERSKAEAAIFRSAALALHEVSGGRGVAFLEPIGHVGDVNRIRILDEVGLVFPEAARRRKEGPGWYADIVRTHHPDYLVIRPDFLSRNTAFAGVGAPFRSDEERRVTLGAYESVPSEGASPLRILRRTGVR